MPELIAEITDAKRAITALDQDGIHPFYEPGPSATQSAIDELGRSLGVEVPKGLRDLLAVANGWPRFLRNLALLSAEEIGSSALATHAHNILRITEETLGPDWDGITFSKVVVFGVDPIEDDLFFFSPVAVGEEERSEVVWWYNGTVERHDTVDGFLAMLLEIFRRRLRSMNGAEGKGRAGLATQGAEDCGTQIE